MIDSHVHLTNEQYKEDLNELLNKVKEEGLKTALVIGCDQEEINNTITLLKEEEWLYGALGYHPCEFEKVTDEMLEELEQQLDSKGVIALGEIGLDYHWYPDNKEEQKELFIKQLEIARKKDLPVIIHARESLDDVYDILKDYSDLRLVVHSFSGNYEEAKKFLDLGFYLGITGPITFKNGENQKDVARNIDLDRLLIETDGPFLTPVPFRGKRNEPQYVYYVAEEIAKQRGISIEEVVERTTNNFKRLFLGE